MSMSSLKPSPLAPMHASTPPRASPFRRQNSSASASNSPSSNSSSNNNNNSSSSTAPSLRATTPTNGAQSNRPATPSKLQSASTPNQNATTFSPRLRGAGPESPTKSATFLGGENAARTSATGGERGTPRVPRDASPQPSQHHRAQTFPSPNKASPSTIRHGSHSTAAANLDALSSLPPQLVRSLRDAFSLLDRDNSGTLTPADVTAMHTQLGLPPPTQTELSAYFPAGAPTPLALPAFLGGLAAPLARMDSSEELLAALGAFDERESGQVGVEDLMDAVGQTPGGDLRRDEVEAVMKGFTGRPKFSRNPGASQGPNSSGEVFRYREWVGSLGLNGERGERDQAVEG